MAQIATHIPFKYVRRVKITLAYFTVTCLLRAYLCTSMSTCLHVVHCSSIPCGFDAVVGTVVVGIAAVGTAVVGTAAVGIAACTCLHKCIAQVWFKTELFRFNSVWNRTSVLHPLLKLVSEEFQVWVEFRVEFRVTRVCERWHFITTKIFHICI